MMPEIKEKELQLCGVVRPISSMDGYSTKHWIDVSLILDEAISAAGFKPRLVSDADGVGIIHGRIVKNLYQDPIVVCDISGKNPNVMLELGIRLAFDLPVVVVKDDETDYSFDTSPIEHVTYPKSLRFGEIVEFKSKLAIKLRRTLESIGDPEYKSFLQHFGPIKVAEIGKEAVPGVEILLDEVREMRKEFSRSMASIPSGNDLSDLKLRELDRQRRWSTNIERHRQSMNDLVKNDVNSITFNISNLPKAKSGELYKKISSLPGVDRIEWNSADAGESFLHVSFIGEQSIKPTANEIHRLLAQASSKPTGKK
jgi:hypothetical protein